MNERIRELAMKANSHHDNSFDLNYKELDVFLSKFAELIVSECAATIANDTANYPGEGMMAYYQGVQDSARAIKKHFGVE